MCRLTIWSRQYSSRNGSSTEVSGTDGCTSQSIAPAVGRVITPSLHRGLGDRERVRGDAERFCHDTLHVAARDRLDVEFPAFGLVEEARILHGGREGAADRGDTLRWRRRRHEERAAERGHQRQELEHLPLQVVLGELWQQ